MIKKFATSKKASVSINTLMRSYFSSNVTAVKSFTDLDTMRDYLTDKKPEISVLLFTAAWNPMCEESTEKFTEFAKKNFGYEYVHMNVDEAPKAKAYYGVKYEPEFILCVLGCEIVRHIGNDFKILQKKLDSVSKLYKDSEFIEGTAKYEQFHERFMEEYNNYEKEYDYWTR